MKQVTKHQQLKIMIVGGGSGGHIAPALAVASELKKIQNDSFIHYVIGRNDKLHNVVAQNQSVDKVSKIFSGKFRRYHGEGLKQLLDLPTILKNFRDIVYILIGFVQSIYLLLRYRPDILFAKGGFVGAPVGLAAAILRIPYITHDSDAVPGLSNRLISRWAVAHAVALNKEVYNYPVAKTYQVGIPISDNFQLVTPEMQTKFKATFGLPPESQVIFITGGGNGASRLNKVVANVSQELLDANPNLAILHIAGKGKEDELEDVYRSILNQDQLDRVVVEPFANDLYRYSGAADVVITRAGANSLAEFANQSKACIIIPNQHLTGGHQLKNAALLSESKAAIVLDDERVQKEPQLLSTAISELLNNSKLRAQLSNNLHSTSQPESAKLLANLIIKFASNKVSTNEIKNN